jgi:subtilisin family serine protease/chitodextrinase
MENIPLREKLSKALILLFCPVVLALLSTVEILSAQMPGNVHERAPKRVIEALTSGNTQDLIVVFDDKVAQKSAEELQSATGLTSHHRRVIEHKAARYTEKKQEVLSAFGSHEASELKHYSHLPVSFLRIHSKEALDKLLANPDVVGVYENAAERLFLAESLPLIGQPQVAAQGYMGAGTAVAVLDTGVDYTKTAFGSCTAPGVPTNCKIVYAQDFAPSDGKLDDNGHGTNVAGIVLGVAPGTKILALDVFRSDGLTYTNDQISAINWVIANKSQYNIVAINMSFGGGSYSSPATNDARQSTLNALRSAGIMPVAASGNDGYKNALAAPAAIPGVVSVGAAYDSAMGAMYWGDPLRCQDTTTGADKVTCFSNSASFLTMIAPGSQILAAGTTMGGTSQASPHVAGAVAVLRAAFPNETLDQTVARLTNGLIVTDSRNDIAKPRLNLPMALGVNASCTYSLSEASKSFLSFSSNGSVAVTTGIGCTWNAASTTGNSDWIIVTSVSSGSGNGTVNYSVSENINLASRTGTITVAGQTYTVTQSGSVGTLSNILLNPGFEEGPISWTDSTANGYPVITTYLNPTTTNNWYAWLCGYNNCIDKLYQDVAVPADAQNAYVQFNYWITSDETSGITAYDTMTVRIYSPPNAATYTYWTLSNLNATTGWVLSPIYDVSAFRGQTIRLQFSATTDASFATDFYVDDVTLMVSGSTPDKQAPTVPTGLTAAAIGAGAVNLHWTASTDNVGVTTYKVYRGGILVATLGNVTIYRDTGLTASTPYTYKVSACDAAGNCSLQSNGATVITPGLSSDTQSPTAPTGLTATVISSSTINLAWTASTDDVGIDSYKVYRDGLLLKMLGNVTSYSDIELTPSTPYSYTVSACDAAGNCSAQSSAILVTTTAPVTWSSVVFSGPSSYQITGGTVNITVDRITNNSWSGHSGSLKIELWALTAPYFGGSVTGYVTASIRTSAVNGLTDTLIANYYFSNIALNLPYTEPPANYSKYALFLLEYDPVYCSMADKFCIIDYMNYHETLPPTVPTGLSSTAISSSWINLTWTASTDNVGVTTYKVYRNGILVSLLGNVTSYDDVGLAASTLYRYTISACDAWENCSAMSAAASATTSAPPDTQAPSVPTGLTATAISSTKINLAWTASLDNVGVTAYKIYISGTLVATLGNVTSSSRTVAPSATYSYTVSACDAAGNCSARSAPALATTPAAPDTQPPIVPTGLTATAVSKSQINLSWSASYDNVEVTAYKIFSSDGQTATLGNVTVYSHTSLRPATAYSYTVAACDAAGNCSAKSASTSATTKPPPLIGDMNGDGTVNLADAILVLKSMSGQLPVEIIPNYANAGVDVNGDNKIGLPEALYILQKVAGMR